MAYCTNCGKELAQNEKFCTNCGASFSNAENNQTSSDLPPGSASGAPSVSPSGKKKFIVGGFILLLLIAFAAFIADRPKETADVSIQRYCNAVFKNDNESLKAITSADDRQQVERANNELNQLRSQITQAFVDMFGIGFKKPSERFVDALIKKGFTDNNFQYRVISEDGKKATVEVSFDKYGNMDSLENNQKITEKVNSKMKNSRNADPIEVVGDALVEVINELPSTGRGFVNVECTYDKEKGMWVPDNIYDLYKKIDYEIGKM